MPKKTFINKVQSVVPTGATTLSLAMKALPSNILVCYDRIAGVDFDNSPTLMSFGFLHGADEILLESFSSPGAGECKAVTGKIFAPGHYRPFIKVTGATAGDKIALYVFGYTTDIIE